MAIFLTHYIQQHGFFKQNTEILKKSHLLLGIIFKNLLTALEKSLEFHLTKLLLLPSEWSLQYFDGLISKNSIKHKHMQSDTGKNKLVVKRFEFQFWFWHFLAGYLGQSFYKPVSK